MTPETEAARAFIGRAYLDGGEVRDDLDRVMRLSPADDHRPLEGVIRAYLLGNEGQAALSGFGDGAIDRVDCGAIAEGFLRRRQQFGRSHARYPAPHNSHPRTSRSGD